MREKPYTVKEFFEKVKEKICNEGNWPDGIDYALPENKELEIRSSEFSVVSQVAYGGSEGIYLDIYLDGSIDEKQEKYSRIRIAVIKTLSESREAMRIMAKLGADWVVDVTAIVNENMEDFTWDGFKVQLYNSEGRKCLGYYCMDKEQARKFYEKYSVTYKRVTLCDMESRKVICDSAKYSLQGTTQGNGLTGGLPPVRFSM